MKGPFQPYAESFEDSARMGTSSVHGDRSDVQPSFKDDDFEHDSLSTHGYLHIPHFPYKKMSPPSHQSSDPSPLHGTNFGYRGSCYASSEPSPELYGSTRDQSGRDKAYHYNSTNRECEECQRQLATCQRKLDNCRLGKKAAEEEAESLRIRLFHGLKEAKKYDEAEKLYYETAEKCDNGEKVHHATGVDRTSIKSEDTVILDLKHAFAGMLTEQRKFQKAEPISRAVWEKRQKCPDPPSEDAKESHRQLCSILCALGRIKDAEYMHRAAYQRKTMDAWALENGDEVCQRLREQRDFQRAKEMQDEVWKERLKQYGPRNGLTIRSGLRLIGFLEERVAGELDATIDNRTVTDTERKFKVSQKQASECEIELILRKIWETRLHPEPSTDILDAGHKLGLVLFQQNKFADAEAIFTPVWEGKKQQLEDRNVSTLSTGSMLGKALYRQGKRETYGKAVNIFQGIWHLRQSMMKIGDAEAISSGEDLAQAYHSLRDWPNAERVYVWLLHQKEHKRGYPRREIDETRWNIGRALYMQGKEKEYGAEIVLRESYQQLNASSPNSEPTLQCGQMLAQLLSTQKEESDKALEIALEVFNGRGASVNRGLAYLDIGRLYGSLLLESGEFTQAESILESVWEHAANGTGEEKMRSKCGHLYGKALLKRNKFPDAKRILETIAEAQRAVSAAAHEIEETHKLLEEVNHLRKEKEREKRNSGRRRAFIFRTSH